MNRLGGKVVGVQSHGSLSLVQIALRSDIVFIVIVIDTLETAPYLLVGCELEVLFKETEVILSVEDITITTLQNKLSGLIADIEKGNLLSRVVIGTEVGDVVAIIGTTAAENLSLSAGQQVTLFINMSEIILAPI